MRVKPSKTKCMIGTSNSLRRMIGNIWYLLDTCLVGERQLHSLASNILGVVSKAFGLFADPVISLNFIASFIPRTYKVCLPGLFVLIRTTRRRFVVHVMPWWLSAAALCNCNAVLLVNDCGTGFLLHYFVVCSSIVRAFCQWGPWLTYLASWCPRGFLFGICFFVCCKTIINYN